MAGVNPAEQFHSAVAAICFPQEAGFFIFEPPCTTDLETFSSAVQMVV
jgi:hypothetical protein